MKNIQKKAFLFLATFLLPFGFAHADTALSQNWAGYIATGSSYTTVGATWTVPTVSTTVDPSADATWVGIGGLQGDDLIQSGTQAIVENGQVTYQAWVETLPQALQSIPLNITPGDSVTVSLTDDGANEWHLSFRDSTTGGDYETNISYASSASSAEWIEEMPSLDDGTLMPLDMFTPVQFSNAYTVSNGTRDTIAQSDAVETAMGNGQGTIIATPSALGADGASFTVTRTSTSSGGSQSSYSEQTPPWKRTVQTGRSHKIGLSRRYSSQSGSSTVTIKLPQGMQSLSVPASEAQILQLLQSLMTQENQMFLISR